MTAEDRVREYASEVATASDLRGDAMVLRDAAIAEMYDEGHTLRQIAEVAGMTHAGIGKVLEKLSRKPS